jgi:hypothetical protein
MPTPIKLTAEEIGELASLSEQLRHAAADIESVTVQAQELLEEVYLPVNDAITVFNVIVVSSEALRERIAERLRTEYDNRSDSWKDGPVGTSVDEFITEWESNSVDELELISAPDISPALDTTNVDVLEDLPQEAE